MFAVNNDRNLAVVVVAAAAVQLTVADRRRSRRRNRQVWVKKYRGDCNDQPLLRELRENYPDDYRNYLRMDCKASTGFSSKPNQENGHHYEKKHHRRTTPYRYLEIFGNWAFLWRFEIYDRNISSCVMQNNSWDVQSTVLCTTDRVLKGKGNNLLMKWSFALVFIKLTLLLLQLLLYRYNYFCWCSFVCSGFGAA